MEDGEAPLIPMKTDLGVDDVEVQRLSKNFYLIVDTDAVIETKFCSEYAPYQEAASLRLESQFGVIKGSLVL